MKSIARSLQAAGAIGDPITVPWPKLNQAVQLHTKELAIVAGAPGAGKSVFALNLAMSLREPALYLAYDSAPSIILRSAALLLNEPIAQVRDEMNAGNREKVIVRMGGISDNLLINSTPTGLEGISNRLEALTELLGKAPKVTIIDNVKNVRSERSASEVGFYDEVLPGLREIAEKHNTCMIALHHVTRRDGAGGDAHGLGTKALKMTDLKYSGEHDSEHVLGLFHNHGMDRMFVQVLKQRDGEADPEGQLRVPLIWHPAWGRLDRI